MPRRKWWLGEAVAALAVLAAVAARTPRVNDVTTGQTPQYPDLQPREYPEDAQTVFRAARATAHALRGWRVTGAAPAGGVLHAEARVFLTPFTDDVTVRVQRLSGGSRVVVRSRSRVGRGDLGVNARRIRAFLRALDMELSTEAQRPGERGRK